MLRYNRNMNGSPLISVVTVCRNAAGCIGHALETVMKQRDTEGVSFTNYEHIVIDGGSCDGTQDIVGAYKDTQEAHGISVTFTSQADEGIYDAMNKGLVLAKGCYVGFLNADDWYASSALATVTCLANGDAPDCIGGACRVVGRTPVPVDIRNARLEVLEATYPRHMPVVHQSLFMRTDLLREVGGFRTEFPLAADYDLFLRLLKHSPNNRIEDKSGADTSQIHWAFTDEVLSYFALGGASYHPIETARDYRKVRLANGWPWTMVWLLYVKNLGASWLARVGSMASHQV